MKMVFARMRRINSASVIIFNTDRLNSAASTAAAAAVLAAAGTFHNS
jgi:hypothetical protein